MMAKKRKRLRTKEERDAWEAHVDETIRHARELVKKGLEELREKRASAS